MTSVHHSSDFETWIEPIARLARQFSHTFSIKYQQDLQLTLVGAALLKAVASQTSQQLTQTELAQDLCISESTVCNLIERFRQAGLVDRRRLDIDRRKTRLELTPLGAEKLSQLQVIDAQVSESIAQQLSQETAAKCLTAITRITEILALADHTAGKTRRAA